MSTPGKAEIKMEQAFTLSPRGITTSNTRNKGQNNTVGTIGGRVGGRTNGYQDGSKASRTIEFDNTMSPNFKNTGDKMRRTAHSKVQTAAGSSQRCNTEDYNALISNNEGFDKDQFSPK